MNKQTRERKKTHTRNKQQHCASVRGHIYLARYTTKNTVSHICFVAVSCECLSTRIFFISPVNKFSLAFCTQKTLSLQRKYANYVFFMIGCGCKKFGHEIENDNVFTSFAFKEKSIDSL